jgi:hypothetical protein
MRVRLSVWLAFAAAASLAVAGVEARAQNIFDFLFGGLRQGLDKEIFDTAIVIENNEGDVVEDIGEFLAWYAPREHREEFQKPRTIQPA